MNPRNLISLLIFISLTACGSYEVSIQPTASPTNTAIQLATVEPTSTVTTTALSPTETETVLTATQSPQMVQIFLIALDDQGVSGKQIGCGDSVVPVQVEISPTQGVLKAALETLLSVKTQYYGESGLYNALYQSDLQLEGATINDGKAVVKLTGTLLLGGECDDPRLVAQLEETVLQFSTVKEVSIFINGKPLSEVVSLRN